MLFYIFFKKPFRPDFKNRRTILLSSPVSLVTYQPTTAPAEHNVSTAYSHFPTKQTFPRYMIALVLTERIKDVGDKDKFAWIELNNARV